MLLVASVARFVVMLAMDCQMVLVYDWTVG